MYQEQFKKWGLGKNWTRERRDELFQLKEAGHQPLDPDIDRKLRRADRKRFDDIENQSRAAMRAQDVLSGGSLQASKPANRAESELSGTTESIARRQTLAMASSPSPPVSIGAGDLNLELVLHYIRGSTNRILCSAQGTSFKDRRKPPSTSNLYSSISQYIYQFKVRHLDRAKPLLEQLYSNDMQAALYSSLTSLRRLITEFSPINFRRYDISPIVRQRLLHHLVNSASKTRHRDDPLLVIYKQLLRDGDTRHTTGVALSYLIDAAEGIAPAVVHRAKKAIITLLRRDRQLNKALDGAEELVAATSGAAPASIERRSALEEKAHILMDRRKEGDLHEALRLCHVRVGMRYKGVGEVYRDKSAMYTMEDIAKIHDELNDLQKSVVWLEQAAHLGKDLRGDRMAMTHIVDKLVDAKKKLRQNSELNFYKEIFKPFMWVPQ